MPPGTDLFALRLENVHLVINRMHFPGAYACSFFIPRSYFVRNIRRASVRVNMERIPVYNQSRSLSLGPTYLQHLRKCIVLSFTMLLSRIDIFSRASYK